jgi:repressor LexA
MKLQTPKSLTEKETKVLDFIETFQRENGMSPSYQEIKDHFSFASFNSVQNYLKQLSTKGYLQFEPNQKRAIQVIQGSNAFKNFVSQNNVRTLTKSPRSRLLPDSLTTSETLSLPLLGKVAAGSPLEALAHDDFIEVPLHLVKNPNNSYVLKVSGESMIEDGIFNDDYLVISNTSEAKNGDTVIAKINNEATVKKFYHKNNQIELRPANSTFKSQFYSSSEVEIHGLVTSLFRKY